MTTPEEREAESDPSSIFLGVLASVTLIAASYVTATLLYAFLGRDGVPVSPLLLAIPAVPVYSILMRVDDRLEPGPAKKRLLAFACFSPLVVSLILVVLIPLPILNGTIPVGGAFGLTVTVCVIVGILLVARAQWKNRD